MIGRRLSSWSRLVWPGIYLVAAILALGANPFRGETVGPFDLLASAKGWNPDSRAVEVRDIEKSDVLDALLPMWIDGRNRLREGDLPLWNALRAGGSPELLDSSNLMLTPQFALFAVSDDPAFGYYLSVLFSLFMAGYGIHLLIARYQTHGVALFGGLSFMLCGFFASWLYMPHVMTAIWIPWLLLAVDGYVARKRFLSFALVSLSMAMMFLGGFPFVVALGMGAALVWGVAKSLDSDDPEPVRSLCGVALGMVVGLCIVAVPMLTLADTLQATGLGYRGAGSALSWRTDLRLLSLPWGARTGVETTMYSGMAVLCLALLGAFALVLLRKRWRGSVLAWSGLVYLMVGAALTFEILPVSIGRHLPVLSNNPWTRAILLIDLGLVLLAAHAIGCLRQSIRPRWGQALLLCGLCIVQAADAGSQFRRFNGPVAADLFYPLNPELIALKKTIRPFQYVAQDSPSFVMSGTLGAIGLPEWFAHSLRPQPLRSLLGRMAYEPFQSRTSTSIRLHRYYWSSPVLDAAGLCYGITARSVSGWGAGIIATGTDLAVLEPVNRMDIVQPFELSSPFRLTAVDIRLATYGESGLDGNVVLQLASADNRILATSRIKASSVVDNVAQGFVMPRPLMLEEGVYKLHFRYEPGPANKLLTIWYFTDSGGNFRRGKDVIDGGLDFSLYKNISDGLDTFSAGRTITVLRNPDCAPGPYFARRPKLSLDDMKLAQVEVLRYAPDRFTLRSDATSDGFVVIPMQYRHGWTAQVDGVPQQIGKVLRLLPVIAVPKGVVEIEMVYSPPNLAMGIALTALGLLALLLAIVLDRRRASPG